MRRGSAAMVVIWFAIACVACGVQETKHTQSAVNSNGDFGPSLGGTSGATVSSPVSGPGIMTTMPGASGAPASGAAAAPGAGVAGMPGMAGVAGMTMIPTMPANMLPDAGMMPSMMPASGVTIDLGGTPVAKENAIAFIHLGHSNMAGRAIGPTATRPYFFDETDPHAWMYHVGQPPALAQEPYTAEDNTSGTYGGPGTALVKEAAALAPDKYFISLGFGKESAYCSQFLPGALYYDSVVKAPLAIKDRVTFGAIVIMLGITERHGTSADISGYSDCINKLVTAIRNDVGRPDLPLLITDYEQEATGYLAVGQAFPNSIIPEIHKIPMVVSNSALVPTDGLGMQDDHHFDFDGHKLWISRVLQIMKDKGWAPWAK
jgi:hypothetical protein